MTRTFHAMTARVGLFGLLFGAAWDVHAADRHSETPQIVVNVPDTLEHDVYRLDEVLVRGTRKIVSANVVSAQIDASAISGSMGKSLADMLEQVSGVSSIRTGTAVAKPVIQGMYGNRILMVNNGARQTGQQWGADHAPEIDMNSSALVEVVKGAESVRYGSEALGGIVVMEPAMLPYGRREVSGQLATLYGSNGRRSETVARVDGAMPFLPAWAWRLQATYGNSGDARSARYLLNNTGTREFHFSMGTGYRHGNFRGELFYSRYDLKLGVLFNAQMGSEELLAERIALGRPVEVTPFSRHITYPYQHVVHHMATLRLHYDMPRWGRFYWLTSFQQDDREENRIRRRNLSYIPAVSMHLKSWQNQLRWRLAYGPWQSEAGVQWVHVDHENQAGTGVVPVIPNHTENTVGIYALQKLSGNRWGAEAGVRFDAQDTRAAGYDWTGLFYGGHRSFHNVTYNIGGHYHLGRRLTLTSGLGLAWRAPHVYELYSNGNELGSGRFVQGDSTLRSERSYKWVTSLVYKSRLFDARLDAYLQWIDNFIYDQPLQEHITVISGTYPLFRYRQTSAFFRGIDIDLRLRPLPALEYHFLTALIWANERSTGAYLPYIPSARFDHSLAYTPKGWGAWKPWAVIRHRFVARQHRFDPRTDLIATAPASYSLFGFDLGVEWQADRRNALRLSIAGDNIFNKEYKEYTNRARYYAHDLGRDIRCTLGWKF